MNDNAIRQSKYFLKTLRKPPAGEQSRSAQLLEQAGYVNKLMAGVYSYLPIGLRVLKKIENIIREEINNAGGQELYMPALHPIENYITTKRSNIDVLFHLKSATGKKLVLGQSHEEVIVPLAGHFINSYKDLPLYLYQIQNKFRNELRAKSGILRSREFIMKDLYSFHTDEKDFQNYYKSIQGAYSKIFKRAGIGTVTYRTFASGGSFSQFSHEYQTITDAGEDTIHLCKSCNVAVNDDIINDQKTCPECNGSKFEKKKSIEVGNIFPLKTKFSDAFGLSFIDKDGRKKQIIMGCYGIGLGRLMGAIVEVHNDAQGIIWPTSVSPFQVHLISLATAKKQQRASEKLFSTLQKEGITVLFDDRDESAGVKLKDSDLIGVPIRLIVSEKTGSNVEIKNRNESRVQLVTAEKIIKIIMEKKREAV